ncbi:MAG TPA: hypothetical protein VIO64_18830 [Pseudobacteroides sp.]|uniref:hypothetical protein n=1 Tax=Pseudobacteroides sp. TaxID=1968840 RepID=UPI002F9311AC
MFKSYAIELAKCKYVHVKIAKSLGDFVYGISKLYYRMLVLDSPRRAIRTG